MGARLRLRRKGSAVHDAARPRGACNHDTGRLAVSVVPLEQVGRLVLVRTRVVPCR
jgi:hypothetical protein